ncbi:hypothetical protein [Catellatospora sichuanensis]|nr:hypothetical protein [Catellatospora sichuanensis]
MLLNPAHWLCLGYRVVYYWVHDVLVWRRAARVKPIPWTGDEDGTA